MWLCARFPEVPIPDAINFCFDSYPTVRGVEVCLIDVVVGGGVGGTGHRCLARF